MASQKPDREKIESLSLETSCPQSQAKQTDLENGSDVTHTSPSSAEQLGTLDFAALLSETPSSLRFLLQNPQHSPAQQPSA